MTLALKSIGSLTRSWDTGAQAILSPGVWFDDDVTPTWMRTNQVGVPYLFKVSGTDKIGLDFGATVYTANNQLAAPMTVRPGVWAHRKFRNLADRYSTPWTYNIKPTLAASPGYVFEAGLNAADTWYHEFVQTIPADSLDLTSWFATHHEPGDAGAPGEIGRFVEITGVVADSAATFHQIDFTRPRAVALLFGDSIGDGVVNPAPVPDVPNFGLVSPASSFLTAVTGGIMTATDPRGALAYFARVMWDRWCNEHGYEPVYYQACFSGAAQGPYDAAIRTFWTTTSNGGNGLFPGLWDNLIDRLKYQTTVAAGRDFTDAGHWTGGIGAGEVKLVSFGTLANDLIQANAQLASGTIGTSFSDAATWSAAIAGTSNSIISAAKTLWPNAKAMLYAPLLDSEALSTKPQNINVLRANVLSANAGFYQLFQGGAHYDDIGFVDILRDIATSEGVPSDFANLHPTWYQQKKIADMAYPTLARVMGESTGPAINPFQLLIQIRLALGEDTEELQLL